MLVATSFHHGKFLETSSNIYVIETGAISQGPVVVWPVWEFIGTLFFSGGGGMVLLAILRFAQTKGTLFHWHIWYKCVHGMLCHFKVCVLCCMCRTQLLCRFLLWVNCFWGAAFYIYMQLFSRIGGEVHIIKRYSCSHYAIFQSHISMSNPLLIPSVVGRTRIHRDS